MKLILFTFLLMITYCFAEPSSNTSLHIAAHFGAAYALTHITEVSCVKLLNEDKLTCTIIGMGLANVANGIYKANQDFPNDTKRALIFGAIGSILAGVVINW